MKNYDSVFDAVNDLIERGYTIDFTMEPDKNRPPSDRTLIGLPFDEFQIDEIHRFESDNSLGHEVIVSAISSPIQRINGIMVITYYIYAIRVSASV